MDIERELTSDEIEFLHSRCHLLAIALHKMTGLPLHATLDVDEWTERTVLVHAYVKDGDDGVDIRGRFSVETIEDDFPVNQPFETEISEVDLMHLGSGKRIAINENGKFYKKALSYADNIVGELGLASPKPR